MCPLAGFMKRIAKQTLSVFLTVTLCLLLLVPAFAVLGEGYYTTLPTIYLQGQGSEIYAEKGNKRSERLDEFEVPDGYIGDAAKALIPPLLKGLTLNKWQEWEDEFVARVLPLVEKTALDENGEASNGSGPPNYGIGNQKNAEGKYGMNNYVLAYDWRLDPCLVAEQVKDYIDGIKKKTGAEKVNMIGRSIGASVVLAYLAQYGMEDLETVILYCPSFYGMEAVSRLFAGKVEIDPKGISRFLDFYVNSGELGESNAQLYNLLKDVVAVMARSHQLDLTAKTLEHIYEKVWRDVYPRLLVKMYGSMPSFWSLVGDADYADAKAAIFAGQEETYKGLIEKIDNFHYNVLVPSTQKLKELVEAGNKVHVVLKYGVPMIPTNDMVNAQSDMLTSVWSASPDATCGPIDGTLSQSYIDALADRRYLSPDRQIDASTCLLPDHTWFIKNVGHRDMPDCITALFEAIYEYDGYMTVFDDEAFPQYLFFDEASQTMSPLTEANMVSETEAEWNQSFFQRLIRMFKLLGAFLRDWLQEKFN
jgi:pimeloyl-ACP methyl ester carboxylesterase